MQKKRDFTRREMLGVMAASTLGAMITPGEARIAFKANYDKNKEVARTLLKAWNERGESYLPSELVSPKLVTYLPYPFDRTARGRGSAIDETVLPGKGFRDQQFKEQVLIADDKYIFIGWEVTGTHAGTLYGQPATGKTVTAHGADIIRVVDGQIVEHKHYYSRVRLQVLARLGLLNRNQQRYMLANGLIGRNHVTGRVNVREILDQYDAAGI